MMMKKTSLYRQMYVDIVEHNGADQTSFLSEAYNKFNTPINLALLLIPKGLATQAHPSAPCILHFFIE